MTEDILSTCEMLENEINNIEEINSWSEKIIKMNEFKHTISSEINKLNELSELIVNDDISTILHNLNIKKKKKHNKLTMDSLLELFNNTEKLEEKIYYYELISDQIKNIENRLFSK
jgi:hypothetical protein